MSRLDLQKDAILNASVSEKYSIELTDEHETDEVVIIPDKLRIDLKGDYLRKANFKSAYKATLYDSETNHWNFIAVEYINCFRRPDQFFECESDLSSFSEECIKELESALHLDHSNVLKIIGVVWKIVSLSNSTNLHRVPAIIMLEPAHETLKERKAVLKRGVNIAQLRFLTQIFAGLWHLHDHEIQHQTLNLSNILLGQDGSIKIADLGYSKCVDHFSKDHATFQDKLDESAPENFPDEFDYSADIFSAGLVALELINLTLPPPESREAVFEDLLSMESASHPLTLLGVSISSENSTFSAPREVPSDREVLMMIKRCLKTLCERLLFGAFNPGLPLRWQRHSRRSRSSYPMW